MGDVVTLGPLERFVLDCVEDCIEGQPSEIRTSKSERWSWGRMVGARHCPECNAEGCDACQMTGWADGREP